MRKTPEEIKKGLACAIDGCMEPGVCEECPYNIEVDMMCHISAMAKDAIAYIEQLEERIDLMMIQIRGNCGLCKHKNRACC